MNSFCIWNHSVKKLLNWLWVANESTRKTLSNNVNNYCWKWTYYIHYRNWPNTVWFHLNYNEACKAWIFTIGIAKLFKEGSMCERKRTDRKLNVAKLQTWSRIYVIWWIDCMNKIYSTLSEQSPNKTLVIHPSEKFWSPSKHRWVSISIR